MRFFVSVRHAGHLKRFSVIGFFSILAMGCSSDSSRFSMEEYVTTIQPENSARSVRRYPENVDPVTTSSIYQKTNSSIRSTTLPDLPVRVKAGKNARPVSSAGWTKAGGFVISLKNGETLLNLSKRYGVPVNELKKINKISDSDQLRVSQKIIIPVYNDSKNVPETVVVPARFPNDHVYKDRLKEDHNKKTIHKRQSLTASNALPIFNKHADNGLTENNTRRTMHAEIADKDAVITGSTSSGDEALNNLSTIQNRSFNAKTPRRTGLDFFRWPVTGRVLSEFGNKHGSQRNEGIDISVPEGTSVKAAENGVVIYANNELQDYGNLLLVRHDGGWVSAYAYNKTLNVKRGDKVRRGQIIAKSGRTGNASGPVLHFELRKDSVPVNPKKYLR